MNEKVTVQLQEVEELAQIMIKLLLNHAYIEHEYNTRAASDQVIQTLDAFIQQWEFEREREKNQNASSTQRKKTTQATKKT